MKIYSYRLRAKKSEYFSLGGP